MHAEIPELVIEAGKSERRYWLDLWRYRELFFFLVWRDIIVRYKQTLIGVSWALVRPLLTMVVLGVVFGYVAGMASGKDPAIYFLGVFAATLPWEFISAALSQSSDSMVSNARLLTKVYFPRLIIPLSTMGVSLVDFFIAFLVLMITMLSLGVLPSWRIVMLPGFLLLGTASALSIGLWMASLNVTYRDFRFIVPILLRLGYFLSPIGYSSAQIRDKLADHGMEGLYLLYYANPIVAVIDGFRWCMMHPAEQNPIYLPGLLLSLCSTTLLLISGVWFFRRTERSFADIV